MPGVVVVGGGFAALEIALAWKKQDKYIPVTVITTETEIVYRPWLIRVPAGGPRPPVLPLAGLLAAAGIDIVRGRAAAVDVEQRQVTLDSGTTVEYAQLIVATGAVADRGRVPGAEEHALFPCDLGDATAFAARVSAGAAHVAVVFGWERPGPGLEYAAWIAAHRPAVGVTAIDGDETMARRFGSKATAQVMTLFEERGAELITAGRVRRIGAGTVELEGSVVSADVIAVVAPLRGATEWLPQALLDEHGRLRVDRAMAAGGGVFGIGDVVAVPEGFLLPPALRSIQATAPGIARNVARALAGAALEAVLRPNQPDTMLPDLAGAAVLVRDRRLLLRGRLPLLLRSATERRYLRSRSAQIT